MKQPLLLILTLLLSLPLSAQEPSDIPIQTDAEEESDAIFQLELYDAEVDIFLTGSWSASLTAATGLLFKEGSVSPLDGMPGIQPGFIPNQVPDITLSLWIMEIYFLEYTYLGDFEDNQFMTGYEDPEGNFLKHLYIGNKDISFPEYPYIRIPETGDASIGLEAAFESKSASHQLLLRHDNNEKGEKLFIGKNEVIEYRIQPFDYYNGRFLQLPDQEVEGLTLFLESSTGPLPGSDGHLYRQASAEDMVVDSIEGLVYLREEPEGRVVAYYTKGGLPVGSPTLGRGALAGEDIDGYPDPENPVDFSYTMGLYFGKDMAEKQVTIEGKGALLMWEPGEYSPFGKYNSYALESIPQLENRQYNFRLVYAGTSEPIEALPWEVRFKLNREEGYVTLYSTLERSLRNHYPLPDPMKRLYGPTALRTPAYPGYEILLSLLYPVDSYQLEPGIIPGSVKVLRNGVEETAFTVDYASGVLTFKTYIHPEERLKIYYKKKNELLHNGDLTLAWGNRMDFDKAGLLEAAMGLRWNILPGAYTEESYSRTGALTIGASYTADWKNISVKASGGLSFSNPDTTGVYLIDGMEKEAVEIEIKDTLAAPSSQPAEPAGLTQGNRGRLLYKDYWRTDMLGNRILMNPEAEIPEENIYPYQSNSKPGPYNVTDSARSSTGISLVMDFEIEDSQQWVGLQLPVGMKRGLTDLSGVNTLFLSFRTMDITFPCRLYLQLGEVGEDLDGDTILDTEVNENSEGFIFNDSSNNANLLVGGAPGGGGNGIYNTEDYDGNGILDGENPGNLISLTAPALTFDANSSTEWQFYTTTLTETQKLKLKRSRGIRLVVQKTGLTGGSGRILVDRLTIQGNTFSSAILNGNGDTESLFTREIKEAYAVSPAATLLENNFPKTPTFTAEGKEQKILEIEWQNLEPAESWEVTKYLPGSPENIYYKEIVLYLRHPQLSGLTPPQLGIEFLDYNGQGISLFYEPGIQTEWQELAINLQEGSVLMNGAPIPGALLTISAEHKRLNRLRLTMSGSESGLMYIDELHYRKTRGTLGAAGKAEVAFTWPESLIEVKGHSLLGNITLKETASITTPGFSTLDGIPAEELLWNSLTTASMELLFTREEVNLAISGAGEERLYSVGHHLQIPSFKSPVSFSDQFNLAMGDQTPSAFRENRLEISLFPETPQTLTLSANAATGNALLTQSWGALLGSTVGETFRMTGDWKLLATGPGARIPESNYFTAWATGYGDLLPVAENMEERKGTLSLIPVLNLPPVGIELNGNLEAQAMDLTETEKNLQSKLNYALTLPLELGLTKVMKLKLIPGYRRSFTTQEEKNTQQDFTGDGDDYFRTLGRHSYLFSGIPGYEIFAPEAEQLFTAASAESEKSLYTPELFLSLKKSIGSSLADILLPTKIEVAVNKSMLKEGDLYTFNNIYKFSGGYNTINLFGKYGAYSFIPWYNIDEFSMALSLEAGAKGGVMDSLSWSLSNLLSFEAGEEKILTIDNNLNIKESSNLTDRMTENRSLLSYEWSFRPEKWIDIPLIDEEVESTGYFSNKEELSLTFRDNTLAATVHTMTLLLNHKTALIFPEFGYLSAALSLGLDREAIATDQGPSHNWRLGVQAVLEARFQW